MNIFYQIELGFFIAVFGGLILFVGLMLKLAQMNSRPKPIRNDEDVK
jgi:hypothetical protein